MGLQVLDESQEYKTKVACQNLQDVAVLKSHANQNVQLQNSPSISAPKVS